MSTDAQTIECADRRISTIHLLVISIRPRDWVKNSFVFAALFFSKNVVNADLLLITLLAFVLFCLAAGGIYLINDICDRKEDRMHPRKATRPVASGMLPVTVAGAVSGLLLTIAIGGGFLLRPAFGFVIGGYIVLTIAYSKWLKHMVIVDIFAIAAGFVLRVAGGAIVIDVVMSHWLFLCTVLLSLFLGFSKRRYEIVKLADNAGLHRRVLLEYDPIFLDMMISIVTSATVIVYILYTVSAETVQKFHTDRLILTIPFVLYGIFRYLYLVYHKNFGGTPSQTLLTDKPLLLNVVLWGLVSGLIIYTTRL